MRTQCRHPSGASREGFHPCKQLATGELLTSCEACEKFRLAGQGSFRAPNDAGKAPRIQTCSPDESAVDIFLTHQLLRVLRLYTSTVLNANSVGGCCAK